LVNGYTGMPVLDVVLMVANMAGRVYETGEEERWEKLL